MIPLVIIIGLIFLGYFLLSIKRLDPVTNVRIVVINGTKYLSWNPSTNATNYVIGLNVDGFLDKRTTRRIMIPLYRCEEPVKANQPIVVQFVIIARDGKILPSPAVSGTIVSN